MTAAADPLLAAAHALLEDAARARVALPLAALAARVGLSPAHLQRRFRAAYGLSPAEFLAQRRLQALRAGLRAGAPVDAAILDAGFGSPSRVYEDGAARLGMTPARYRAGGAGETLRYALVPTALGRALVAASARGLAAIELAAWREHAAPAAEGDAAAGADADASLEARLRAEFPRAQLERVDAGRDDWLAPRLAAVADALAGRAAPVPAVAALPLDLRGTAFQVRVWEALMRIPAGETRSYAGLAEALGMPRGARAVARACAGNRLALVVPCHRVVRGDGSLGGYRWGLPLKRQLLAREAEAAAGAGPG